MGDTILKGENKAIDIAKLVFAFSVVAIHTVLFSDINYNLFFILQQFLLKLAVPFFFICSGVFYRPDKNEEWFKLPKAVKRLIIPYFAWSIIYIVISRDFDIFSILKGYLIASPGAAMWFVGALIISMVILKFIKTKRTLCIAIVVSLVFYYMGFLLDGYSEFLEGVVSKPHFVETYFDFFESTRNFLFKGFPLVALGHYIGQYGIPKVFQKRTTCALVAAASLVIMFITSGIDKIFPALEIKGWYFYFGFSFLRMLQLLAVLAILCLLLQTNIKIKTDTRIIRKLSTGIYFSHMTVLLCVNLLSGILYHFGIIEKNFNSVVQFVLISGICVMLTLTVTKINNKCLNKLF